ncbi:hypothetical protein C8E97_4740 [Saccharothrix australiensis]|uniref:Uncharacterized protein n=1 Tax=Saccharothrix australiensis TaxID=2072 RepID=A0A495W319_9PSEU|nr:hypothetical protein C8E97_4740 [Saccharothrix australiensis]
MALLVANGLGPGLHQLIIAGCAGRAEQLVIGEVDRAAPDLLRLADVVIGPDQGSPSAASLAFIVVAFGFPAAANRPSACA